MQRMSLIGAGFIGTVHAGNLASHPGVDFVSVYDPDRSRAGAVASRFGASLAGCVDEALHGVDAVYIASSTDTHAELLRAAVDAGVASDDFVPPTENAVALLLVSFLLY